MQGRTLQEVADGSGVTKSLLSKIENGKSMPPLATLTRIAGALGVKVSALLDGADEHGTIFTPASETGRTVKTDKGYAFFSFAAQRSDKQMQTYLFEAEKGRVKPQPLSHRGEEFIYVLEGRMQYSVGPVSYTLGQGDSLYFDAEEDHDLEPITKKVRYLAVFVER